MKGTTGMHDRAGLWDRNDVGQFIGHESAAVVNNWLRRRGIRAAHREIVQGRVVNYYTPSEVRAKFAERPSGHVGASRKVIVRPMSSEHVQLRAVLIADPASAPHCGRLEYRESGVVRYLCAQHATGTECTRRGHWQDSEQAAVEGWIRHLRLTPDTEIEWSGG